MGLLSLLFGQTDTSELTAVIKNGACLVDVRSQGEFASGSVKGALNIPLDSLPHCLNQLKGKKSIVLFCRSGARSAQAKRILEKSGYKNVLNGGTWQAVNKATNG